jgi:hypothetical protein
LSPRPLAGRRAASAAGARTAAAAERDPGVDDLFPGHDGGKLLVYRENNSATLFAAYLGACRVGYITIYGAKRIYWNLILIRPEGGQLMGWSKSVDEAREDQDAALREWLRQAGLRQSKKGEK